MKEEDVWEFAESAPQANRPELRVTIAGRFYSDANYQGDARTLADEYVLIYTEAGAGHVRVGDERAVALAGDAFLLFPGIEHQYGTQGGHWHHVWFHGVGRVLAELVRDASKSRYWLPPTPVGAGSPLAMRLAAIIREMRVRGPFYEMAAAAHAQAAAIELIRCHAPNGDRQGDAVASRFERAAAYIQSCLSQPLREDDVARCIHVSPRHLRRLFHRAVGRSFQEYVLQARLSEAKRLLYMTDRPIGEIAAQVGFMDRYYFSRVFRQKIGQSPSDYRATAASGTRVG